MQNFSILELLIYLPFLGALIIALLPRHNLVFYSGIFLSLVELIVAANLYLHADTTNPAWHFLSEVTWLKRFGFNLGIGVDNLSLNFIMLTVVLIPIVLVASLHSIKERAKEFVILMLLSEAIILGVFISLDLALFYLFFELSIVPLFFIIGIWGGEQRRYAAVKFFLYTLTGSLAFLISIVALYNKFGTTNYYSLLLDMPFMNHGTKRLLWIGFMLAFVVKVPLPPFHTWLPDAHVQAPTAGSVILAGVLLKLGGYGILRFVLPLFPEVSRYFANYMIFLSLFAIIYASLVAWGQKDFKKLIAYSSIAHMGYVTLGIFSFNNHGYIGSVYQMISHGIVSGGLFLIAGFLYDRLHTKEIRFYGGIATVAPRLAFYFMLFTMASVGLPITSGFVGEFLVLNGFYAVSPRLTIFATSGVVLGAIYMLSLYKKSMFGVITNEQVTTLEDTRFNEVAALLPIALLILLLGIYPSLITEGLNFQTLSNLKG